jgi:uncharacterized damage-inducible protein DinB
VPYDARGELLEVYGHNPTTLRTLIRDLPDDAIKKQGTGSERWSILEIVCHLRDTEQRAFARVRRMVEEDRPFMEGYDPDKLADESDYQSQSLDAALNAFEMERAAQIEYLNGLNEDRWKRTGLHGEVGEITVQDLTAHMAAHDSVHLAQISRRILEMGG